MKKVNIIAEIGVNHNGSYMIAKKMIKEAKKNGADAVKFQNFNPEEMALESTKKAKYQIRTTSKSETHFQMLQRYRLEDKEYKKLREFAKKINIKFISTPFDFKSLKFLVTDLKLERIKVSSTDIDNIPLLIEIGRLNINVILSSGMSSIQDVDLALSALAYGNRNYKRTFSLKKDKLFYKKNYNYLKSKVVLMHCTSEYPAPKQELNLNVLKTYFERYKIDIGYSDHSCHELTPVICASLCIREVEVHVTLDKKMEGPDHKSSLDFRQFKKYVDNIRETEILLGSKMKFITKSEKKNIKIAKKSLVSIRDIKRGELFTSKNLGSKRPGIGISPKFFYEYVGRISKKNILKNTLIKNNYIK